MERKCSIVVLTFTFLVSIFFPNIQAFPCKTTKCGKSHNTPFALKINNFSNPTTYKHKCEHIEMPLKIASCPKETLNYNNNNMMCQ
jgi:hypothetical protein